MNKTMGCIALSGALVSLIATTAFAATYDLSDEWNYSTSQHWHDEYCPPGEDTTGTATITQDGETFTLTIDTGMLCEPAWTCEFHGFISADDWYMGFTGGELDEVEGSGTGVINFEAFSFASASGQGNFTITLEETTTCSWGWDIELVRAGYTIDNIDDGASDGPFDTDTVTDDDTDGESDDDAPTEGPSTELDQACDCITVGRSGTWVIVDLIALFLSTLGL